MPPRLVVTLYYPALKRQDRHWVAPGEMHRREDWSIFRRIRRFGEDVLAENMDLSSFVALPVFIARHASIRRAGTAVAERQ